MPRQLSSYEKTHLARFGKGDINIADYGEMPVEYITGKVEFCGRIFTVNPNVLIPRVETEELVKIATDLMLKITDQAELLIADIGCGCGAIGITLGQELFKNHRRFKIYLSDVSIQAVEMARQNIQELVSPVSQNKNQHQLITLESDLMTSFPNQVKFDLLVANLPYIPAQRIAFLDESVKDHEPHLALDGGPEGLTLIDQFLHQATEFIKPGGFILLEIDYTHRQRDIEACLPNPKPGRLKPNVQIIEDSFNRQRFALIKYPG